MLRPTKAKIALFLVIAIVSFSPLLLTDAPRGIGVLPALQMFWFPVIAKALGLPVTAGQGVDAFSLAPFTTFGYATIVIGVLLSLLFHYCLAGVIVTILTRGRRSEKKAH